MPARLVRTSLFVAVAVVASPCVPAATQGASAQQADYTQDQAEAGATVYRQACSECHLANLRGSFEAPELTGTSFRASWRTGSVAGLLDLIRETMPPEPLFQHGGIDGAEVGGEVQVVVVEIAQVGPLPGAP